MGIEVALRSHLLARAALVALIGERIFPAAAPQGAVLPRVVYQRVTTDAVQSLRGASGLEGARIQLDAYAATYAQAAAIAHEIKQATIGHVGFMGGGESKGIVLLDERDLPADPPAGGGATPIYRRMIDIRVWFEIAKPR